MTIPAKYDSICARCNCRIRVGQVIDWQRGRRDVWHAYQADCDGARALAQANAEADAAAARAQAPAAPAATMDLAPVAAFLHAAQSNGLTHPRARFLAPDNRGEMRLELAGARCDPANVGAVYIFLASSPGAKVTRADYYGMVRTTGEVRGKLATDAAVLAVLQVIARDPAGAAREYGRMMRRCGFCQANLSDDRSGASVEMGYGPDCARRWNLPWHPKGAVKTLGAPDLAAAVATVDAAPLHGPLTDDERRALAVLRDADERDIEAALRARERAEDDRVAAYKARRDTAPDSVDRADAYYSNRLGF